ncbi:LysR family transcriptional regulator [Oceanimonas baumannii]|uniref:DNA-binding transcriptional LysR family regulator n=1 Tax=Oceanimonas baumannii TaxID=129578 RepID=A0A235CHH3_9GAMM|nr:LysR family transcriptional regulator [Oceanimonas baumannii]OYD23295.1 LysR family transcriptional regulator [Oceanimonas baumannii]TDW58559.1 DNA-binding transcriptional LysR family regulator [Oceanimonas baumannii]
MRHLRSFHIFHVAASSATYSEAADKLNITHGAVSKQIKVLEHYLSQPLFYKRGRHVFLTREGELLKTYTEQAFQTLESGVSKLLQQKHQCLEVSCEPTLTMRWLMPRLSGFNEGCDADIRLSTAGGPVTLGATGLSMAIRRDDFEQLHNYPKLSLVEEWVGPVVSPEYWQQVQANTGSIKLLHSQTRPRAWEQWLSGHPLLSLMQNPQQTFAHFYFCIQAAVDGLGAALGPYPLIMDDLKRGNLIAPFGFVPSGHDYVLLHQDKAPAELEQRFTRWLQAQMAQCVPTPAEAQGNDGKCCP